jgi:hypothetical protein
MTWGTGAKITVLILALVNIFLYSYSFIFWLDYILLDQIRKKFVWYRFSTGANPFLGGLPFLHFCKKYDICTGNRDALTFGFGKKSVMQLIPPFPSIHLTKEYHKVMHSHLICFTISM